ncbi:MAG: DUF1700 domain-containing protein [Eubacteriales bacterium]|nr:DUF1700 domain-containing protein [Eubacteriales bacterium]
MNRKEYLKQLEKYLRRLPSEDYQNAIDYFTELFDEAGPEREAEVIADLGSPKEASAEILSALLDKQMERHNELLLPSTGSHAKESNDGSPKRKGSLFSVILLVVLTICAAPIAAPLAITAVIFLLCGVLLILCMLFCLFTVGIALIGAGITAAVQSFTLLAGSFAVFAMTFGVSLLFIGLGIFLFVAGIFLSKWMIFTLISMINRMIRRR